MNASLNKPLVTFMLFAYNHEKYIREAVEGALAQTYTPLEIILSDDCSTDKTFEIIQEIAKSYTGKHQLVINRNEKNLGLAEHVNGLFKKANGEIIVLAAGDDISLPHRVSYSQMAFENNPELKFVDLQKISIDENGCLKNNTFKTKSNTCQTIFHLDKYISDKKGLNLNGAGRALHNSVFKNFGPLLSDTPTEDSTYILRSLMIGHGMLLNMPGVLYRKHATNLSGADSLPYIPVDKIYDQYMIDANKALSNNLITQTIYLKIVNWIEDIIERRKIDKELYFAKNKFIYTISQILLNRSISIKAKMKLLKKTLKTYLKKLKN